MCATTKPEDARQLKPTGTLNQEVIDKELPAKRDVDHRRWVDQIPALPTKCHVAMNELRWQSSPVVWHIPPCYSFHGVSSNQNYPSEASKKLAQHAMAARHNASCNKGKRRPAVLSKTMDGKIRDIPNARRLMRFFNKGLARRP
jgi:hypothetical protein